MDVTISNLSEGQAIAFGEIFKNEEMLAGINTLLATFGHDSIVIDQVEISIGTVYIDCIADESEE